MEEVQQLVAHEDIKDSLSNTILVAKGTEGGDISNDSRVINDSWVDKTSSIYGNSSLDNSFVKNNSTVKKHSVIKNSSISDGSTINGYAFIEESSIHNSVIDGSVLIKDSHIDGRTMIMKGTSNLNNLTVLQGTEERTEFHIRGTLMANGLSVSGEVVISGDNKTIRLPDNVCLGSGAVVHSPLDVSVLHIPLMTPDDHKNSHEWISLTGHPSEKYEYAVSILHKGKLVSLPVDDLEKVLVPLFGMNYHNATTIKAARSMFSAYK